MPTWTASASRSVPQETKPTYFNTIAQATPLFQEGDITIFVDEGQRQNFLQLLMANEEVSPNVLLAIVDHEQRTLKETLFDGSYAPETYSNESGRLRSMADGAMLAEFESITKDNEEAIQKAQVRWETAYKVMAELSSGALGAVPVAGDALGTGAGVIGVLLEEPAKDLISAKVKAEMTALQNELNNGGHITSAITGGHEDAQWHVELQVAHVLMQEGLIDIDDFQGTTVPVQENGAPPALPASPQEWGDGHDNKTQTLMRIIDSIPDEEFGGRNVGELVDDYVEGYLRSFQARDTNSY